MTTRQQLDPKLQQDYDDCGRIRQEQIVWVNHVMELATSPKQISSSSNYVVPVDSRLSMRPLYRSESEALATACQCKTRDWNLIRLMLPTDHVRMDCSNALRHLVSRNNFQGTVVLIMPAPAGQSSQEKEDSNTSPYLRLDAGLHSNLLLSNCIFHLDARIYENALVEHTYVGPKAVLVRCGRVAMSKPRQYGSLAISVGAESGGGRKLSLDAESTMIQVCDQLTLKPTTEDDIPITQQSTMNILCARSIIVGTAIIDGVFLYFQAFINAASSVVNALLFPAAQILTASTATNVMLQWNGSISGQSTISDAMLMEHAHAGPHSLISNSILGPDVHVSAGEIHASLLGPNTNAHHQSILIGVLWPLGRGNVGYGANVGSNHTGRLPDQETAAGEGVFWGLSCVIKFPVDLSLAPYSIVAAGTQLNPQRVCMPFSLIVSDDVNGGNSIIPGWVLTSSPYTLARSERKYATRRKAVHHDHYTGWKIIRPEVIEQCIWALQSLLNISEQKLMYNGDRDIPGIGTAHLTEKGRLAGIDAYSDCISRFALSGLFEFAERSVQHGVLLSEAILAEEFGSVKCLQIQEVNGVEWKSLPWKMDKSKLWTFQKCVLVDSYPNAGPWIRWTARLLQCCSRLERQYAESIYKCKHRDDSRGASTIPGYADCHVAANDDEVIREARSSATATEARVLRLIEQLGISPDSKL